MTTPRRNVGFPMPIVLLLLGAGLFAPGCADRSDPVPEGRSAGSASDPDRVPPKDADDSGDESSGGAAASFPGQGAADVSSAEGEASPGDGSSRREGAVGEDRLAPGTVIPSKEISSGGEADRGASPRDPAEASPAEGARGEGTPETGDRPGGADPGTAARSARAGAPRGLDEESPRDGPRADAGDPPEEEPSVALDGEGERPSPPPPPEVDRERAEVRVPCRFVNATRQIEVFACHNTGPTHETVVEFDATGPQLYEALRQIGCRPTDFWNATSPSDFPRNQGDRVLVLLRWTREGETHELPAEALLLDGDTGFSSFVRGFSFSAPGIKGPGGEREQTESPPGEAKVDAIPMTVEITLGATQRGAQAALSLLSHPTNLGGGRPAPGAPETRALLPWTFPPLINTARLPGLRRMVEEQTPVTLIFRRVGSEIDVIRYARSIASRRGEDRRLPVYEVLEPLARRIDRLKERYEKDVAGIEEVLAHAGRLDSYFQGSNVEFETRARMLQLRGQWLCALIQELYFRMYEKQAAFRLEELRRREDLAPVELEVAETLLVDGLGYEVEIARRETERESGRLRELALTQEIHALELERQRRLLERRIEDEARQIADLGPDQDYVRTLHLEEKRRLELFRKALRWRALLNDALLREIELILAGEPSKEEGELSARRRAAEQGLRTAKLKGDLLGIEERLRWAEDDLESDDPRRERDAGEEHEKLQKAHGELEAKIDEARKELSELERRAGLAEDSEEERNP